MQSETDLMRYDNFGSGSTTDYGGIGLLKTDGKAHLYRLAGYVNGQPGSGTGELAGITGTVDLEVTDGRHEVTLTYGTAG